ncbi:hypothetical protein AtEden1_Chr5g0112541 [Arabidopsis thaliana]
MKTLGPMLRNRLVQVKVRVVEASSTNRAVDEVIVMVHNRQGDVEKVSKVEILVVPSRTSRKWSSTRKGVEWVLSSSGFKVKHWATTGAWIFQEKIRIYKGFEEQGRRVLMCEKNHLREGSDLSSSNSTVKSGESKFGRRSLETTLVLYHRSVRISSKNWILGMIEELARRKKKRDLCGASEKKERCSDAGKTELHRRHKRKSEEKL